MGYALNMDGSNMGPALPNPTHFLSTFKFDFVSQQEKIPYYKMCVNWPGWHPRPLSLSLDSCFNFWEKHRVVIGSYNWCIFRTIK